MTTGSPNTLRIFVYGAGKLGGYTACLLGRHPNTHVTVQCRSNYDSVTASGFKYLTKSNRLEVFRPQATVRTIPAVVNDSYDFVVCANKVVSKDGSCWIPAITPLIGPKTSLVLCQNGLPEHNTLQAFPNNPIITAIFQNNVDEISKGVLGQAARLHEKAYTLGCYRNSANNIAALEQFASLNKENFQVVGDIARKRWTKLAVNITLCYSAALFQLESHQLLKTPSAHVLMQLLAQETGDVASANGVEIPPGFFNSLMQTIHRLPSFAPSMLQDVRQRGAPIEIKMFTGQLKQAASKAGVKTPALDMVSATLSALPIGVAKEAVPFVPADARAPPAVAFAS